MSNDAFTAGVLPGGLISKSDIKILVCYLLKSIQEPVSDEDIINSLTMKGIANYFEIISCVSELATDGHIVKENDKYRLSSTGGQIVAMLSDDLPLTIKARAVSYVKETVSREQRSKHNLVDITPCEGGYTVNCRIMDDSEISLYSVSLYAPTRDIAQTIRSNFIDNAEQLMRQDLSLLTGEQF